MFDPLLKQKAQLKAANQAYHLAKERKDARVWLAKEQSKDIVASPQGLAASFAAGSYKGATSGNSKGQLIRILSILAKNFI